MPDKIGGAVYELNLDVSQYTGNAAKAEAVKNQLVAGMRQVDSASAGVTKTNLAAGQSFGVMGFSMKDTVRTAAAVALGMGGLSVAITGTKVLLGATVAGASALTETLSKSEVVFGSHAGQMERWSQSAASSMGISQQAALESAATFGNLFVTMGLGPPAAADMSRSLVQLASDLASFNNADPSTVLIGLRAGLVGEIEPLRRYGIAINEAVVQQKAMSLGLVDAAGNISEAGKVQARYALILEQTKTAQGDFARTSGDLANSSRIFKATAAETAVTIGQQLLPAITKGTQGATLFLGEMNKAHVIQDVFPTLTTGVVAFGVALAGVKLAGFVSSLQRVATERMALARITAAYSGAPVGTGGAAAGAVGALVGGINPVTAAIVGGTVAMAGLDIAVRRYTGSGILDYLTGQARAHERAAEAARHQKEFEEQLASLQREGATAEQANMLLVQSAIDSANRKQQDYLRLAGQMRDAATGVRIRISDPRLPASQTVPNAPDFSKEADDIRNAKLTYQQLMDVIAQAPHLEGLLTDEIKRSRDAAGEVAAAMYDWQKNISDAKAKLDNFNNALKDLQLLADFADPMLESLKLEEIELQQLKTTMGDAFGPANQARLDEVSRRIDILTAQHDRLGQSIALAGEEIRARGGDMAAAIQNVTDLLIKLPEEEKIKLALVLPDLARIEAVWDKFIAQLRAGATIDVAIRFAVPQRTVFENIGGTFKEREVPTAEGQRIIDELTGKVGGFGDAANAALGPISSASKAIDQQANDLAELAAAYERFHAATGGSVQDFRVLLRLTQDKIDLDQRQEEATIALRAAQEHATDANYQLRAGLVAIAEEAVRAGTLIPQVVRDVFRSILDNAKSTLDQILNAPTRESTEMQLRIDRLQLQADQLIAGGADASRVDNAGKPNTRQPSAQDRQLKAILDQIRALEQEQKIRQDRLAIMRDEAILADQTLQTDKQLINAYIWSTAVIGNLSRTVMDLDSAMAGLVGTISAVPKLDVGMPYVPRTMLAVLHEGEGVLTAQQNRLGAAPSIAVSVNVYADMTEATIAKVADRVEAGATRALNRWRGGVLGSTGTNS